MQVLLSTGVDGLSVLSINTLILSDNNLTFSRYVAEHNKWTMVVHKGGDTSNHVKDTSTAGTEEEDTCADCMSGSPSSGGSSQSFNGKGKKKKGKTKDKKVTNESL